MPTYNFYCNKYTYLKLFLICATNLSSHNTNDYNNFWLLDKQIWMDKNTIQPLCNWQYAQSLFTILQFTVSRSIKLFIKLLNTETSLLQLMTTHNLALSTPFTSNLYPKPNIPIITWMPQNMSQFISTFLLISQLLIFSLHNWFLNDLQY